MSRSELIFDLPTLAPGESLEHATLQLWLYSIEGDVADDADVYHLMQKNTSTPNVSDFQFVPANLAVARIFNPNSETASDRVHSAEVTSFVQADYTNDVAGSEYATFRVQVKELTTDNGDGGNDRYYFGSTDDTEAWQKPILMLTINPAYKGTTIIIK